MSIQSYLAEVTAGGRGLDLARVMTTSGRTIELTDRDSGGVVRADESVVGFARMEFALLRVLVDRRRAVADPDRAFVPWHEIAANLSFRSVSVDSENVRELVRRVRRKLATAGLEDLIESRKGIGYRLGGTTV
jgi:DNA-binding response OmpR family regulator